ncbi:MAG: hypothetical protein ACKVKW_03890 [Flavobacteriales bacterium]|jgi:hypothetical protein|nr:hypothetical protein [Schleiferiaceae bacterium]
MKNKHFLGLVFLGLGLFTVSATMKVLHLQGAAWLLIFADALLALGLIGLAFKSWSSSDRTWLNR